MVEAVNNIWLVPILEITAMQCSEDGPLIGHRERKFSSHLMHWIR
jgi:hypothetical protein